MVGKFVEFYGPGLDRTCRLADRATIANMAPEYGATCGFFPIDEETIRYLTFTGRDAKRVALVEAYAKAQGCGARQKRPIPVFTDTLNSIWARSSRPWPARSGRRTGCRCPAPPPSSARSPAAKPGSTRPVGAWKPRAGAATAPRHQDGVAVAGANYKLDHGDVVIAAITSPAPTPRTPASCSAPACWPARRWPRA